MFSSSGPMVHICVQRGCLLASHCSIIFSDISGEIGTTFFTKIIYTIEYFSFIGKFSMATRSIMLSDWLIFQISFSQKPYVIYIILPATKSIFFVAFVGHNLT